MLVHKSPRSNLKTCPLNAPSTKSPYFRIACAVLLFSAKLFCLIVSIYSRQFFAKWFPWLAWPAKTPSRLCILRLIPGSFPNSHAVYTIWRSTRECKFLSNMTCTQSNKHALQIAHLKVVIVSSLSWYIVPRLCLHWTNGACMNSLPLPFHHIS